MSDLNLSQSRQLLPDAHLESGDTTHADRRTRRRRTIDNFLVSFGILSAVAADASIVNGRQSRILHIVADIVTVS
jgi:hypothetical protein